MIFVCLFFVSRLNNVGELISFAVDINLSPVLADSKVCTLDFYTYLCFFVILEHGLYYRKFMRMGIIC